MQRPPDVVLLVLALGFAMCLFGLSEAPGARPGGRQTLLAPLHDQVAFDLGKEPEADDHPRGLEILLTLKPDGLLD